MRKKRKTQCWNKLDGARVMQNALRAMPRPKFSRNLKKKPLIRVLAPFRVVRAKSLKVLEKRIREVSKGKDCERVFIRGNPVQRIKGNVRLFFWHTAPRGNLCTKTNRIVWDVEPRPSAFLMKDDMFLLYATKPREQIEKDGALYLWFGSDGRAGKLEFGKEAIEFSLSGKRGTKVSNVKEFNEMGDFGKPLSDFIKVLVKQADWKSAKLRFVKWKGEKGIEFFDFRRDV